MTARSFLAPLLLTASVALAAGADPLGSPYSSEDLTARAPGAQWKLHEKVDGAPLLRGLYTYQRIPDRETGRSRSSMLSFTIENDPKPAEPGAYLKTLFDDFFRPPPLSFRLKSTANVTVKGMPGVRVDYADRDDLRQFAQYALKIPDGRLLIVVLQAADKNAFAEDQSSLKVFLDGVAVKPVRRLAPPPRGPAASASPAPER